MNVTFQPQEHLLDIGTRGKPRMYLEVKYRLVWFRLECPQGTIRTEIVHIDLDREVEAEVSEWDQNKGRMVKVIKHGKGLAIVKATVSDGKGGEATGTKMENAAAFGDFLEKAETGSIGRALAGLGYGTQFTGDELDEGSRIVDAPVQPKNATSQPKPVQEKPMPTGPISEQQIATILKLQKEMSLPELDLTDWTFADAANMLKELAAKRQARQKAS